MVYQWKRNLPVKAQVAGEYIEDVEREFGSVTPKILVDLSRNKDAVLNRCFEWDDGVAAEKYRETQAGGILRNLVVVSVDPGVQGESVRAFVSVSDNESGFVSIRTALENDDIMDGVLIRALAELNAFKRKYQTLRQLKSVFSAIEDAQDRLVV